MIYNDAMERRELRLPGVSAPRKPDLSPPPRDPLHDPTYELMKKSTLDEHRWMSQHFPKSIKPFTHIITTGNIDAPGLALHSDESEADGVEDIDFIIRQTADTAVNLGREYRKYQLIKKSVLHNVSGLGSRRMRQSCGIVAYPGLVGQHGEFSMLALNELSDRERHGRLLPLAAGFLDAIHDDFTYRQTGAFPQDIPFSVPDTPLAADASILKSARIDSSQIATAFMKSMVVYDMRASLEGQVYKLLGAQRDTIQPELEPTYRECIREFFKQLSQVGLFMQDMQKALLNVEHPKHEEMLRIFDERIDRESVNEVLEHLAGCYDLVDPTRRVLFYRQSEAFIEQDTAHGRLSRKIRMVLENHAERQDYSLNPDDPDEIMDERPDIFPRGEDERLLNETQYLKGIARCLDVNNQDNEESTEQILPLTQREEGEPEEWIKLVLLGREICYAEFDLSSFDDDEIRRIVRILIPLHGVDVSEIVVNGIDNKKNTATKIRVLAALHHHMQAWHDGLAQQDFDKQIPQESYTESVMNPEKNHPDSEIGRIKREMLNERRKQRTDKSPAPSTLQSDTEKPAQHRWPSISNYREMIHAVESGVDTPEDRRLIMDKIKQYHLHGVGLRDVTITKGKGTVVRLRAGKHRLLFMRAGGKLHFTSVVRREDSAYW